MICAVAEISTTPLSLKNAEGYASNAKTYRDPSSRRAKLLASFSGKKRRPALALVLSTNDPSRISVAPSG